MSSGHGGDQGCRPVGWEAGGGDVQRSSGASSVYRDGVDGGGEGGLGDADDGQAGVCVQVGAESGVPAGSKAT
jgi:hypothetical protein